MHNNAKLLEISKLVFELIMVGNTDNDLDALLEQLFGVLQKLPSLRIQPKGAILMFSSRNKLVRVAQYGLKPFWLTDDEHDELKGFNQPFSEQATLVILPPITEHSQQQPKARPVCVLPLHANQQPLGQVLLFVDFDWAPVADELEFLTDFSHALSSIISRFLLNATLRLREIELEDARTEAIRRLGTASEYRDNETGMHVMRMTNIAGAIAKAMGLSDEQREILFITAPMHDVGKIGIADAILLKPGRLTSDEFDVMKTHTEIGGRLLKGSDALIATARDIALCHHENWDGSGYPLGTEGEEIPVLARICSIADVFDALMSNRPYKDAWPLEQAVEYIRNESGKKFDPSVVNAFEKALPDILRIRELYREDVIDPTEILNLPELPISETRWICWDESLSVGIAVIDEHHRYLFDLVNDLIDVVANKMGARELVRVLKALGEYALIHFQAEERMMQQCAYPRLDIQIQQHQYFLKQMKEFNEELHKNPLIAQFEILIYLRDWLVAHIRDEDTQLSALIWQASIKTGD
jgi:hemerythrin-like metal-binding protein